MLKSNLKKIKIAIVGGGFYGCYLAKKISGKIKLIGVSILTSLNNKELKQIIICGI